MMSSSLNYRMKIMKQPFAGSIPNPAVKHQAETLQRLLFCKNDRNMQSDLV
jgi:hypothetical protein